MLAVAGRPIVVIASGERGVRVAVSLSRSGARVTLVSPDVEPWLDELGLSGVVVHVPRVYVRGDLVGAFAAVCLEGDETADAVAAEAECEGCLVHVEGRSDLSTFRFADDLLSSRTEELR